MNKLLISGCLIGEKVRYDGNDKLTHHQALQDLNQQGLLISVCPEVMGGLGIPRDPSEIEPGFNAQDVIDGKGRVISNKGTDVSREFLKGANRVLEIAKGGKVKVAIMKSKSPSCGNHDIYDGSFSGKTVHGSGVAALLLKQMGVQLFNEFEIDKALSEFKKLN